MSREAAIRTMFDASGRGLEIGPSYNPIVAKRDGFRVDVLDHVATDELRAKYANEPGIDVSRIEAVDFVWDGRPLSEVVGAAAPYDYVVASHVIEHTPDLLGFLRECDAVLKPTGRLFLAVPDKRRCFDVFRPLSSTGQILQAHRERRARHLPATAFEHVACFATLDGVGGWSEGSKGVLDLLHSLSFAQAVFDRSAASDAYFDFHAWVFTPSSFRLIVHELAELGSLHLREVAFRTTPSFEFYMTLGRTAAGCPLDRTALLRLTQDELREDPTR
jgi:SAM-dependent methyltransferase